MPLVKGGRRKPSLSLQWASIALASVATAFIPASSQAAQAALGCPGTVQTGAQFVTEVTVDVGTTPLGSYGITLTYDGAVLTVVSVAGGNTSEFSGTPTNNKNVCSGANCETRLSAFQNASTAGPMGVVSVAKVTFSPVASSDTMAPIGLTVRSLFDTGGNPIAPATGTGCTVSITTPPTTTTTTTPPSTTTTSTSTSTTTSTSIQPSTTTTPPSTTTTTTQLSTTTTTTSTTTTTTSTTTTTTSTTTTTTRPTTSTSTSTTSSTSTQPSTTTTAPSTSTTTARPSTTTTTRSTTTSTTTTRPSTTTTSASSTTSTSTSTSTRPSTTTSTTSSSTTRPPTTTSTPSTTTTTGPTLPNFGRPDCTAAVAEPPQLWPPNHKFVDVSIVGVSDPDGDPVTITVTGIAQDEPIGSQDLSNPCPDASGVGSDIARLRAERSGSGGGRVYHVAFLANDGRGGQCNGTVTVCVPKSSRAVCVDQEPLFDSVAVSCSAPCDGTCTVEMAVSSVCVGESLPLALSRALERSRVLLARAAEATSSRKMKHALASATKSLQKVARLAGHAAQQGTISPACAGALEAMLDEARAHLTN